MIMVLLFWAAAHCFPLFYLIPGPAHAAYANVDKIFNSPNPTAIQHMIVENQQSGRVYLGAVNYLYQLGPDLKLEAQVQTGPQEDSIRCSSRHCTTIARQMTDNINKGLAYVWPQSKLIVCGSLYQGACGLRSLYNISHAAAEEVIVDAGVGLVANDNSSSSVIFVAPGPPDLEPCLYVASTYTDLGPYRNDVPAVGTLSLDPSRRFQLVQKSVSVQSQIVIEGSIRSNYKIDYVYGFPSGNFSYFITRQPRFVPTANQQGAFSSPYISKLIRLCQRDLNYFSYTEVPLTCEDTANKVEFELIQAAFVGKAGFDLANQMGISTNDDVLFAVFARDQGGLNGGNSKYNVPAVHSALCVYSMRDVENVFLKNIQLCANGTAYLGLEFLKLQNRQCIKTSFPPGFDVTCGNDVNSPLGGGIPVEAQPAVVSTTRRLSSVVSTTLHSHTVVFLGTADGHMKKAVVENSKLATEYSDEAVTDGDKILQDMAMDLSKQFVYMLSASAVRKVRVERCSQYTRCDACLGSRDPYCGWCSLENRCSIRDQCSAQWLGYGDGQCTSITKVEPDHIQFNAAHYLKLFVRNLPQVVGQLSCVFTVGGRKLKTNARKNYENDNDSSLVLRDDVDHDDTSALKCPTPLANLLPDIPPGEHHIVATLSVQIDEGPDFAATNFTFYDCNTYTQCTACSSSQFPCDWCVEKSLCTPDSEDQCRQQIIINSLSRTGPSTRKGPQFCPAFVPLASETDIVVHSGDTIKIAVRAQNIQDFQENFQCQFGIGASLHRLPANLTANKELQCAGMDFAYFDNLPTMNSTFSILWGNGQQLDNPQGIKVVMYKCDHLANNCGDCLQLEERWHCGWCQNDTLCRRKSLCSATRYIWVPRGSICPDPKITKFYPRSGPTEGGTELTIEGFNLGSNYSDIRSAVTVNSVSCDPVESLYIPGKRIVCVTQTATNNAVQSGPVAVVIKPEVKFTAVKEGFYYVKPEVNDLWPQSGPKAGGTILTLRGQHLDAGSNVSIMLETIPCALIDRNQSILRCKTGPSNVVSSSAVYLLIDKFQQNFPSLQFTYKADPFVTNVIPNSTIVSGGLHVQVRGDGFDVIQAPLMYIHYGDKEYNSSCNVTNRDRMICYTPELPIDSSNNEYPTARQPLKLEFGFFLDDVQDGAKNLSSKIGRPFTVFPNPNFTDFGGKSGGSFGGIKYYRDAYITLDGKDLDLAITSDDVTVQIGKAFCSSITISTTTLTCKPPEKEPLRLFARSENPEVIVTVGNKEYQLGYLSYNDPDKAAIPIETIIAIAVAISGFILALVCVIFIYKRKATSHHRHLKQMQDQINTIEMKVASECKEAFAELQNLASTELQTDIRALAADKSVDIPFLSYRDYAIQVLFPNNVNPSVLRDLQVEPDRRTQVEKGLRMLNQLLMNKSFLLCVVRTLEQSKYFVSKDRVYVGSLLMVILQEKLEYCTEILRTLLAELIERTMERRLQPRILFRRSESVAERMLGAWFTFLMYRYLRECAGQPLFLLYWAIKQQQEKGPLDTLTHDARYSLSEQKLIRQTIEYRPMTIYVVGVDDREQAVQVRVLDCDSIAQVKEKCLDTLYKTTPYSQRPVGIDLDLEWRPDPNNPNSRLVLQDVDASTKSEPGGWKRLNTLHHYKIQEHSLLAMMPRQSSVFNLSLLSDRSEKSTRSLSTFSLKNSPTLTRALSPMSGTNSHITGHKDPELGFKSYHLVKPSESEMTSGAQDRHQGKLVSEVYLTRLLTTKGTLQPFVEDLFETVFSVAHRGNSLPLCVKYMFDFLDDQALQYQITDCDTVHAWKSNSLPLRFWVNLIKNPHFVFDIARPVKIEGCLSVVAQTLMDSCSTQDQQLTKDSPSSKLLFAKDILQYRDWVDRYYADVRRLPAVSDQDMAAFLAEESRQHQGEFHTLSALSELYYKYIHQYKETIYESLEEDEFSRRNRLPQKFLQLQKVMDGDLYPTS